MPPQRNSNNGNRFGPTGLHLLTYTGRSIDITAPQAYDIELRDIAAGLAAQTRYSGQCPFNPTIAQHSMAVAAIVAHLAAERWGGPTSCGTAGALLHDAAEAYVHDLTGALKLALRAGWDESRYDAISGRWDAAIADRFSVLGLLLEPEREMIREADRLSCAYEMSRSGWSDAARVALPSWAGDLLRASGAYREASPAQQTRDFLSAARAAGLS